VWSSSKCVVSKKPAFINGWNSLGWSKEQISLGLGLGLGFVLPFLFSDRSVLI